MLSAIVLVEWDPQSETTPETTLPDGHELDPMAVLREVEADINGDDDIMNPLSILNFKEVVDQSPLISLPQAIADQWVRPDLGRAIVVARLADQGMYYHRQVIQRFRDRLAVIESRHSGVKLSVRLCRGCLTKSIHHDQRFSEVTGDCCCRDYCGSDCYVPFGQNGPCQFATELFAASIHGDLPGLDRRTIATDECIMFTVSLGIAVDDTIHFLVRFRRELAEGQNVDDAIRNSITSVGAALVVSTGVDSRIFGWCDQRDAP